jgi:hypothetical protein
MEAGTRRNDENTRIRNLHACVMEIAHVRAVTRAAVGDVPA